VLELPFLRLARVQPRYTGRRKSPHASSVGKLYPDVAFAPNDASVSSKVDSANSVRCRCRVGIRQATSEGHTVSARTQRPDTACPTDGGMRRFAATRCSGGWTPSRGEKRGVLEHAVFRKQRRGAVRITNRVQIFQSRVFKFIDFFLSKCLADCEDHSADGAVLNQVTRHPPLRPAEKVRGVDRRASGVHNRSMSCSRCAHSVFLAGCLQWRLSTTASHRSLFGLASQARRVPYPHRHPGSAPKESQREI